MISKTPQKFEEMVKKIKDLKNKTMYPPIKKNQADLLIIEFFEKCEDRNAKEFIEIYKTIKNEY